MKGCGLQMRFLWLLIVTLTGQAWPTGVVAAEQSVTGAARSPQSGASGASQDLVTLNFVNADIEGVIKAVSEITGKNFVLDPRVKGVVNIVSAKPLSRALVYEVFLSALRLQGFAAIEDRGIVKIVPESDAKLNYSPTLGPNDRSRGSDQIQTQVFTLKYESAAPLVPILRPLIAPNNSITAYPNTNSLVITDYASNLRRIERIIDSIDQPSGNEPVMIPLRYASALDVAQIVNRVALAAPRGQAAGAAGADSAQQLTVVADARSNSLVARSDNPSRLAQLRVLVAMLDSPTSSAGNIHVVYMKNAEAVKVAETLRSIYLGQAAPEGARTAAPLYAPATTTPPGASPATTPLGASASALLASAQAPSGSPGIIQADAATNSVIINAPDAIYNNLRAALDKLDVRRAQVYVEALIAELTAQNAAEFGIQWQNLGAAGRNSPEVFGGTNFGDPAKGQNILGIAQNPGTAGPGLNVGVINGTVTIPGIGQVLNLSVLIRALEKDGNANILSTPTLLTLDNEEARIIIGQNVPFITGSYAVTGAATTPTPFQTIERKDVGLTLQIKPQISENDTVRLQIYQEVSSVDNTVNNPAGVTTNKRAVTSTVLVNDGQIVVIGGLMQDSVVDGVEKVPLFGDLPLIGSLFQYKTRAHSKTNLMVFLRPTVVRTSERADSFTSGRYDYILGEQRKAQPKPSAVLPNYESPSLPPRLPRAGTGNLPPNAETSSLPPDAGAPPAGTGNPRPQ